MLISMYIKEFDGQVTSLLIKKEKWSFYVLLYSYLYLYTLLYLIEKGLKTLEKFSKHKFSVYLSLHC